MKGKFTTLALASAAVIAALATGTMTPAAGTERAAVRGAELRPGDTGPDVTNIQTRLNNIGIPTTIDGTYSENTAKSVEHFQWKFFLNETGILNSATSARLTQLSKQGAHIPAICKSSGKIVCGDKTQKVLRLFKDGKQVLVVDARFGGRGNNDTREGTFRITRKVIDEYSTLYNTPMPYASYFSGGQALHYSKYFAADGYNGASHGCVGVRSRADAKTIYRFATIGTRVKVYH